MTSLVSLLVSTPLGGGGARNADDALEEVFPFRHNFVLLVETTCDE